MSDFFILKINQFSLEMNVCVADQVYARCSDGIAYIGTVTEVDPIRNEVQVKVWPEHTNSILKKFIPSSKRATNFGRDCPICAWRARNSQAQRDVARVLLNAEKSTDRAI